LDKKAISKYNGEITQKANDIYELYKAGYIDAGSAEKELNYLKKLKDSLKAPKKISLTVPKIPQVNIKTPPKMPLIKFSTPSTSKLKLAPVKRGEVPKLKLKQLSSPKLNIKRSYFTP
jgi:hypothetical protein